MAKKKSRRRKLHAPRDTSVYRQTRSALRVLSSPRSLVLSPLRLIPLGDGRFFHPSPKLTRPFAASPRSASRLIVKGIGVQFADPRRVVTCVRRKIRREVLFALGVGGQGGRKNKPRKTAGSEISC